MALDIDRIRRNFPSLAVTDEGRPRVYFDNPGGTQVPNEVIDAMVGYLSNSNANEGGLFQTSRDTGTLVDGARAAMADLLNATSPDEIIFGQNMTTLTLHLTRSIARTLKPGDEIVITRMDHEGNIGPWLLMAEDHDLVIRWVDFDAETFEFDLAAFDAVLNERTKLVAVNYASNATGTISNIRAITKKVKAVGALMFVDAVQYVPHQPTDVQALGCDFLACSAYKFFGPHQGILWGRKELLEELFAYRLRPAPAEAPGKFETGTMSFESMAGTMAAVDYLAGFGAEAPDEFRDRYPDFTGRRRDVHAAMDYLTAYEIVLTRQLIKGLQAIDGVTIVGLTGDNTYDRRVPTVSFTVAGRHALEIDQALADRNIFVWSGNFYAVEIEDQLGLAPAGGMIRAGIAHYNTAAEVDVLLTALKEIIG